MRSSDKVDAILPALLTAKQQIAALPLVKDRQGDKARYIALNTLLAAVEPILALNGMLLMQDGAEEAIVEAGVISGIRVRTRLIHAASGQWLENAVLIPLTGPRKSKDDRKADPSGAAFYEPDAQAGGISLTYGRRYGIFALLSIAVDEDTDGARQTRERRARAEGVAESVAERTRGRADELRARLASGDPKPAVAAGEVVEPPAPSRAVAGQARRTAQARPIRGEAGRRDLPPIAQCPRCTAKPGQAHTCDTGGIFNGY